VAGTLSRISAVSLALAFSGCAMNAVGPSYQEAKPTATKPDAALVFVVRDYAEPTAISADITVDKAPVVDLLQKGFTWFYLKPGKHELRAGWGLSGQQSSTISLDFEAGQTYYLELVGISQFAGMSGAGGFITVVGSGLNAVTEAYAVPKLEGCRYQRAKGAEY